MGAQIEILAADAYGSADALRAVKDKIKSDFIVVPCDLLTDYPLEKMMANFRLHSPSVLALFSPNVKFDYTGIGPKEIEPVTYMGLDSANERFLSLDIKEPNDDNESHINVYMPIINQCDIVNMYSDFHDSHVYLMKHWVLNWLCDNNEIISIKEDLLPLLVKCQYSKVLRSQVNISEFSRAENGVSTLTDDLCAISDEQLLLSPAMKYLSLEEQLVDSSKKSSAPSTAPSPRSGLLAEHHSSSLNDSDGILCLVNVNLCPELLSANKYCVRVNTIPAYFEINRLIEKPLNGSRIATTAEINALAQLGPDCIVGEGTKVSERTSVKKSVIGAHCNVGKFVKISNSIIMDYVTLEDGVKLETCIISSGAIVRAKSSLTGCEVGSRYTVEPSTNAKSESFVSTSAMSADDD